MALKRRNTSSPEPDNELLSAKRRALHDIELNYDTDDEDQPHETPYFDDRSGQSGAFPGLLRDSDELFYGPADDGIAYLRMVRSEAKGVPYILAAPVAPAEEAELEDVEGIQDGGYYYDGAYTATNKTTTTEASHLPPAQVLYYNSLLAQFKVVRASLRCSPPLASVEALRSDQFISFPENITKVQAQWEEHMLADPHPVQVACMDSDTIVRLIQFLGKSIGKMLLTKDEVKLVRFGAWVWAILSRCRDRDELASEEIGDLRVLAQSALRLQEGGRGGEKTDEDEGDTEEEPVHNVRLGNDSTSEVLPDTLKTDTSTIEEATDDRPTRQELLSMTCDMIVTIVGEVYGQRDLLESRKKWLEEAVK